MPIMRCRFSDIHKDSLSMDLRSGRVPLSLGNLQQVFVSHSLHEAISKERQRQAERTDIFRRTQLTNRVWADRSLDRKSTRLNSSHRCISYAVFCLKKKKKKKKDTHRSHTTHDHSRT